MPPNLRIYREDVTEYWPSEITNRAGTIESLYVFDANNVLARGTFAERHELHFAGTTWSQAIDDDDERQDVMEKVMAGDVGEPELCYFAVPKDEIEGCERLIVDSSYRASDEELLQKAIDDMRANGYIY